MPKRKYARDKVGRFAAISGKPAGKFATGIKRAGRENETLSKLSSQIGKTISKKEFDRRSSANTRKIQGLQISALRRKLKK